MKTKLVVAVIAAFVIVAPIGARAAEVQETTTTKTTVTAKTSANKAVVKAASCARCRSFAEGADTTKASKAVVWTGTVIGINTGSHDVIITEATALNRIKAFQQRNISIDGKTKIVTKDGDEKDFDFMDIGYRVEVKGSYDAKKRTIKASSIEIIKVPDAPITKTK